MSDYNNDPFYRHMLAVSKQQAQERERQQQHQQKIDEARINSERERLRAEHLKRTRIYEAQLATSAAASSSAAGSGGGSNKIKYGNLVTGQTEIFVYEKSDTYHYIILDYSRNKITPETDTQISSIDFVVNIINPIQETGYFIEFANGGNKYHLFINDNGQTITKYETNSDVNYVSSSEMILSYVTGDTNYNCYAFDGQEVSQFDIDFGGEGTNFKLVKGPAVYISVENYGDKTHYVWSKDAGLVELETITGQYKFSNGFSIGESADFIITPNCLINDNTTWSELKVWDSLTGTLKSTLSLTASHPTGNAYSQGSFGLYGKNKAWGLFSDNGNDTTPWLLKNYNGDTNTWTSMTHSKANYSDTSLLNFSTLPNISYPVSLDGVFNSPGDALVCVFASPYTSSLNFNIDLHTYCDIVWSIDGSTFSSYTVSDNQPTRGLNMNDDQSGSYNTNQGNTYQYFGKTIFLQALLGDNNFSLVNLGAGTHSIIPVAGTGSIDQTRTFPNGGNPGWAAFRAGDRFGVIYTNKTPKKDIVKLYAPDGTLLQTATMSGFTASVVTLYDNAQGNLAIIDDVNTEYVWNGTQSTSVTFATYSNPGWTNTTSIRVYKTDDGRVPTGLVRYISSTSSSTFRIYTDTSVSSIITASHGTGDVVVAEDFIVIQDNNAPITYYVYDMTGTLINTINTSDSSIDSFGATKNRVFAVTYTGSNLNAHYISTTDYHTQAISANYIARPDDVVWNSWD